MTKQEVVDPASPAIGISLQLAIDDKRTVVFQGFVPADCQDAEFNERLDKMMRAGERHQFKVELTNERKALKQRKKAFQRCREDLAVLDERHNNQVATLKTALPDDRRNKRERITDNAALQRIEAERGNAHTTLKRLEEDITESEARIAELELLTE